MRPIVTHLPPPLCSIQRNRERLLALGIPTLVSALEKTAEAERPKKQPKKKVKVKKEKVEARVKQEAGGEEERAVRRCVFE